MAKWSPSPLASVLAPVATGGSINNLELAISSSSRLPPRTGSSADTEQNPQLLRALIAIHDQFGGEEKRKLQKITDRNYPTGSYDPFFIPHSILFDGPVSPQKSSTLLQLPNEILTQIFQHVKIPYFQVCLALTCKTMGRIASQKNAMAPWRGYRDKDGLFRLLQRNNYIPPSLRLCRACFRFLERDAGYWSLVMTSKEFDRKSINWFDILGWMNSDTSSQHSCPWCCLGNHISYHSQQRYLDDRKGLALTSKMRMCPELPRRMDRP